MAVPERQPRLHLLWVDFWQLFPCTGSKIWESSLTHLARAAGPWPVVRGRGPLPCSPGALGWWAGLAGTKKGEAEGVRVSIFPFFVSLLLHDPWPPSVSLLSSPYTFLSFYSSPLLFLSKRKASIHMGLATQCSPQTISNTWDLEGTMEAQPLPCTAESESAF